MECTRWAGVSLLQRFVLDQSFSLGLSVHYYDSCATFTIKLAFAKVWQIALNKQAATFWQTISLIL